MHLWARTDAWRRVPIDARVTLTIGADGALLISGGADLPPLAAIVSCALGGVARAALLTAPDAQVTVNGYRPLSVALLDDRDAIAVGGQTVYFAAHGPTDPRPFPTAGAETRCARCKAVLQTGDTVVPCPGRCGSWYHEGALAFRRPAGAEEQRACFSYDSRCAGCQRELAHVMWSPQDDESC